MRLRTSLLTIAVLVAPGCGDIETTPTDTGSTTAHPDGGADLDAGLDLSDASDVVAPLPIQLEVLADPYAIGTDWYAYDGETHVLTPEPRAWLVRRAGRDRLFAIDSYYDDRGTSGVLTLTTRAFTEAAWTEAATVTLDENVKAGDVCLTIEPAGAVTVDCDGPFDLVARIEVTPVPAAGFAVGDPALHVAGHRAADPSSVFEVAPDTLAAAAPGAPDALAEAGTPVVSPALDATASHLWQSVSSVPLDEPSHRILQITGDMKIALWQRRPGDGSTLELDVVCVDAAIDEASQANPHDGTPHTVQISGGADGFEVVLVDLCDPAHEVARSDAPLDPLLPRGDTFDLVVEWVDGAPAIRPAPNAWVWDATAPGTAPLGFDAPVAVPGLVWEL